MNDYIWKYGLRLIILTVRLQLQMSEPLRLSAIPVVFTIYGPIRKIPLEIHREAKGDGSFVGVDTEQVTVIDQ